MNTESASLAQEYSEQGIVSPVDLFSSDEIIAYRAKFDELEQRMGKKKSQIGLIDLHFKESFVWEMASAPKLIETMRNLIGEDILLLATHFFCKYPEKDAKAYVAWHQDVTYWGLDPAEAHTAWIAVDNADVENGSMLVLPGSHKNGLLTHGVSESDDNLLSINQAIPDELIDKDSTIQLRLKAGQISVHDGMLAHASMPNGSDRRRCGLTVRFISPKVKCVETPSYTESYSPILVSGKDDYRNFQETAPPFPFPKK